ncbi:MAG: PspC domain-containing protein [Allosphingosinicella sp.]|uniref:PspC domain-containing protein n=1 Tax=Allosphingosinicella sp. TaxID=2823234 RepID=UPI00395D0A0F
MTRTFHLDKDNAKLMGVCAGIARSADLDPLAVRLIAVALTLFLLGPVGVLFYFLIGWLANES